VLRLAKTRKEQDNCELLQMTWKEEIVTHTRHCCGIHYEVLGKIKRYLNVSRNPIKNQIMNLRNGSLDFTAIVINVIFIDDWLNGIVCVLGSLMTLIQVHRALYFEWGDHYK
jgi:hypothetical protein